MQDQPGLTLAHQVEHPEVVLNAERDTTQTQHKPAEAGDLDVNKIREHAVGYSSSDCIHDPLHLLGRNLM